MKDLSIIDVLVNIILFIAGNACLFVVSTLQKLIKDINACFSKLRNLENQIKELKDERD